MARKSLSASKRIRRPLTAKGKLPEDDPEKHWEIKRFGPIYLKWGTKAGFNVAYFYCYANEPRGSRLERPTKEP